MINGVPVKYRKYDKEKEVIFKNIKFERELAEKINRTISLFNSNEKAVKINNDLLVGICVNEYLENFDDDSQLIRELKKKLLEY